MIRAQGLRVALEAGSGKKERTCLIFHGGGEDLLLGGIIEQSARDWRGSISGPHSRSMVLLQFLSSAAALLFCCGEDFGDEGFFRQRG